MKKLLVVIVGLSLPVFLQAQFKITGNIQDAKNGNSLIGAHIFVEMKNNEEAQKAIIEINEKEIRGRITKASEAKH